MSQKPLPGWPHSNCTGNHAYINEVSCKHCGSINYDSTNAVCWNCKKPVSYNRQRNSKKLNSRKQEGE